MSGFEAWMKQVNRHLVSLVGLVADDLEDWTYRDAYDEGMTPQDAAIEALDYAGFSEVIDDE